MKKKVLILTDYYTPSIKAGGPVQSIKNLVENLCDKIDFYIITTDRDLGDDSPFQYTKTDDWVQVGEAKVYYIDRATLTMNKLRRLLKSIDYNTLYLNSFFSYKFTILPIILYRFNMIKKNIVVLSPRGEFSPGALSLKKNKKTLFILIAKKLGLYKGIIWNASTSLEKDDIQKNFGNNVSVIIASDLTANYKNFVYEKEIDKKIGELKIVFISRVHPKKNLKKAIEFLKTIYGRIDFDIYGPIEDKAYWEECKKIIECLPSDIKVTYKGVVAHEEIIGIFIKYHVFLFPTLGENFGHVISEALVGGCPVIISDQTPWRNLETMGIGYDIDLKNEKKFISEIQKFVNMSKSEYNLFSQKANEYGLAKSNSREDLDRLLDLFDCDLST